LWDVAATTLARPPALEVGATATFWNPSATITQTGLRAGAQSVQTSATLGLNGFLLGVSQSLGSRLGVGLLYGRVQVEDLVRTSTSPVAEAGEIPVYQQFLGVSLGAQAGPVRIAGIVRGHDARFDIFRESGFTVDVGATATLAPGITIAASSQFQPVDFSAGAPERYFAGAQYAWSGIPGMGSGTTVTGRYGVTIRRRTAVEHHVGLGAVLAGRFALDAAAVRERGAGTASWRPVVAVSVTAGRYHVVAARGGGVEDLGANYRVGMDVQFTR
jgi:hypothetical protein